MRLKSSSASGTPASLAIAKRWSTALVEPPRAITVLMALGGSTNAVLHLLAIANEAGVPLALDDFNRIGDKTPHVGDLKPFGHYVMNDVDRHGGIPVLLKALLEEGLLHGDAVTVTGKTMAE